MDGRTSAIQLLVGWRGAICPKKLGLVLAEAGARTEEQLCAAPWRNSRAQELLHKTPLVDLAGRVQFEM